MLELFLPLLIAMVFGWSFFAGLTEKKTGIKNYWLWPFILTYWYGLGRPKPVAKTEKIDSHAPELEENLAKNIKDLNASILMLIQKLEQKVQTNTQKAKQEIVAKEKTNQGE